MLLHVISVVVSLVKVMLKMIMLKLEIIVTLAANLEERLITSVI